MLTNRRAPGNNRGMAASLAIRLIRGEKEKIMVISRVIAASALSLAICGSQMMPLQALADAPKYSSSVQKNVHRPVTLHQYLNDHPKVKSATIGAGVGTAAGAVTGLLTGRGILRGAAIGAGTGAGVGLIRSSEMMSRHPIMRTAATGAAVGGGLGWAAGHGGRKALPGAAVGGAVGLGVGMLKHL